MPTIEYYLNGQLIATSEVNTGDKLVDVAASIKAFLDTTPNKMDAFVCEFRNFTRTNQYTPSLNDGAVSVIVPGDLLVPDYRIATILMLHSLGAGAEGTRLQYTMNPANLQLIRVDIVRLKLGLGAILTPNTVIKD